MRNVINNKIDKKIIIFITAYKRKKKKKLSEDFGLGYRSEHSHDYAGSTLFNNEYYDRREQISDKEIAIKIADKIARQKTTTP